MTRWFHAPLELRRRWRHTKKHQSYLDKRYQFIKEIGHGASGIVHLAMDTKTNKPYAIKELNKSRLERQFHSELLWQSGPRRNRIPSDESMLGVNQSKKRKLNVLVIEEIEILKQIPVHENIVQFINVIQYPAFEESIFIVTEFAGNSVVMDVAPNSVAKPYSDDHCRNIFKQLVNAVDHLHRHDILHRDIKPQNLILSNDNKTVKLIDFGNATKITDLPKKNSSSVGSPAFMAPELLKKDQVDTSPTNADLWSMGVTLYCLAYGKLPFEKSSLLGLYTAIQNNPVVHSNKVDPVLCDLIDKLLKKNPKDRISIKDVKIHPWMQKL